MIQYHTHIFGVGLVALDILDDFCSWGIEACLLPCILVAERLCLGVPPPLLNSVLFCSSSLAEFKRASAMEKAVGVLGVGKFSLWLIALDGLLAWGL